MAGKSMSISIERNPAFGSRSFSAHCPNCCGLPARELSLRQVPREQGSLPRVVFGFWHYPKPHPKLASLQMSDEAIRSEAYGLAQFVHGCLGLQVDAESHAEHDSQVRILRVLRDALAETLHQVYPLLLGERSRVREHPEQRALRLLSNERER